MKSAWVYYCILQFSLPVVKYDRHGYKPRKRALVLTEQVSLWDHATIMWLSCDPLCKKNKKRLGLLPPGGGELQAEGAFQVQRHQRHLGQPPDGWCGGHQTPPGRLRGAWRSHPPDPPRDRVCHQADPLCKQDGAGADQLHRIVSCLFFLLWLSLAQPSSPLWIPQQVFQLKVVLWNSNKGKSASK